METTLPQPCPECGETGTLTLRTILVAKPPGSASLAGVQLKTTAHEVAEVRCSACGASQRGRLEGVELAPDSLTITGGHFVAGEG